jgi:hypothetical protein
MIHELTHVWQYVTDGLVYIPQAVGAQAGDGYDYGGIANLRTAKTAGHGLRTFNREQQGQIVADYFNLIQSARTIEASGAYASATLREQLDVYIYFVKEVSTLTPTQLDTPDPPIKVPPVVAVNLSTVSVAMKPSSSPTVTPPAQNGSVLNNALSLNAAFTQLGTLPTGTAAAKAAPSSAPVATVSTEAIDLAFAGVKSKNLDPKKTLRK